MNTLPLGLSLDRAWREIGSRSEKCSPCKSKQPPFFSPRSNSLKRYFVYALFVLKVCLTATQRRFLLFFSLRFLQLNFSTLHTHVLLLAEFFVPSFSEAVFVASLFAAFC